MSRAQRAAKKLKQGAEATGKSTRSDDPTSASSKKPKASKDQAAKSEPAAGSTAVQQLSSVPWKVKAWYYLTDNLLTEVEENSAICCGLGFDAQGEPKTKGVSQAELQRKLADKVLLPLPEFKHMEKSKAGDAIKNRLASLRKDFVKHKDKLKDTGEGLLSFDDNGLVTSDDEVRNVFEKILLEFPWYQRMRGLMGASPVYDTAAVVHSKSAMDFSGVLLRSDTRAKGAAVDTPASGKRKRDDADDTEGASSSGSDDSDSDSDSSSEEEEDEVTEITAPSAVTRGKTAASKSKAKDEKLDVKPVLVKAKQTATKAASKKARTPLETLNETLAEDRASRMQGIEALVKQRERQTDASVRMAEIKLEMKREELQAQERDRAAERAFQLELARLKYAAQPMGQSTHTFPMTPTHAPAFTLDHALGARQADPLSSSPPPQSSSSLLDLLHDIPPSGAPFMP